MIEPRPDMGEIEPPAEPGRLWTAWLVCLGLVHLVGEGVWRSCRVFRIWSVHRDIWDDPVERVNRYTGRRQKPDGKGGWTDAR